jgi:superfamily II DNA/RNA helicase
VGRTGRAGAGRTALSLCGADEPEQLASIGRLTRRRIQKLETPTALEVTRGSQPAARPDRERRPHARRRTGSGAASLRRSRGGGRRPNSVAAGPRPV